MALQLPRGLSNRLWIVSTFQHAPLDTLALLGAAKDPKQRHQEGQSHEEKHNPPSLVKVTGHKALIYIDIEQRERYDSNSIFKDGQGNDGQYKKPFLPPTAKKEVPR